MNQENMKAAVWHGPNDLRVENKNIPDVVAGSILLKVESCAVCGSDLRIFREGNVRIEAPRIIGHEIAGTVVEIGENVTKFSVGDRVSVGADIPCGECEHCKSGRPNCCDINLAIGYQYDGGFAEYILLPPIVVEIGPVQKIATEISTDYAALAEPLACCLNGYELATMKPGLSIAVFGAGPIGLMLIALAKQLYNSSKIIAIEPSELRRQKALEFGANIVIDPIQINPVEEVMRLTNNAGIDRIFTACPVVQTHEQAVEIVAKRGVINFFFVLAKSEPPIKLLSNTLHYKEAYIMGSHGSTPEQHLAALKLIENGKIDVKSFVTHSISLNKIKDALNIASSGDAIKVIIKPNE